MAARLVLAGICLALCGITPVAAQQQPPNAASQLPLGTIRSPILLIDPDKFFTDSAYGKRVLAVRQAQRAELAAENRRIEADLAAEERRLTELRPTLPPDDFRILADAFDEKVRTTEETQIAKERTLGAAFEKEQAAFRTAADPLLGRLMQDAGAVVLLDRRSAILGASAVDITDDAIALIDDTLGDGARDEADQ